MQNNITILDGYTLNPAGAARRGVWHDSKDFCFWDFPLTGPAGKTMGIVGFGRIAGLDVLHTEPPENRHNPPAAFAKTWKTQFGQEIYFLSRRPYTSFIFIWIFILNLFNFVKRRYG